MMCGGGDGGMIRSVAERVIGPIPGNGDGCFVGFWCCIKNGMGSRQNRRIMAVFNVA